MDLKQLKIDLEPLCLENEIEMLGVFGSVARHEDSVSSDIDLLVRFKKPVGLIELGRIEKRFENLLRRRVDMGTEAALHPLVNDSVSRDLVVLYEG